MLASFRKSLYEDAMIFEIVQLKSQRSNSRASWGAKVL